MGKNAGVGRVFLTLGGRPGPPLEARLWEDHGSKQQVV